MSRRFLILAHRVPFIFDFGHLKVARHLLVHLLLGNLDQLGVTALLIYQITSPSRKGPRGRLVQPSLSTLSLARPQEFLFLQIRFSFFHLPTPPTPSKMTSVKKNS